MVEIIIIARGATPLMMIFLGVIWCWWWRRVAIGGEGITAEDSDPLTWHHTIQGDPAGPRALHLVTKCERSPGGAHQAPS